MKTIITRGNSLDWERFSTGKFYDRVPKLKKTKKKFKSVEDTIEFYNSVKKPIDFITT